MTGLPSDTAGGTYDVLISGGGPVGLGLAIELGQRGIRVAVVERNQTPPRIPKGQNLTQRTMEHMQAWGVEDQIRAAKTIPKGYGLGGLTAYGSLLSGYHYDWFKRQAVDQYYSAGNERLPQYKTEAVLRARVADLPSVRTFYGWKTTAVDQTAGGVTLEATQGGDSLCLSASFLVGCDGAHSLVRRSAGISETRDDHDRLMALIVFSSPEFFRLVEPFRDKQFYNVLHPDQDGYWMFFGMVEWQRSFFFHAPVPADINRETFDFKAFLHKAVGREFALDLDYVGYWDLRISSADTYRKGRIFIAGDAAHSHPPYGGYGINTGFEDARNLGWKLAAVLQGWGDAPLLDSYEDERRPVFLSTARDFIGRFIEDDRTFVRAYNPDTNRPAFEAAWHARAQGGSTAGIASFAPHYEGSPCVSGSPGGEPSARGDHTMTARAGHHLPPLTLSNGDRITDHIGPGFVHFAASAQPSTDRCPIPLALGGPEHLIVRPDGFVAGLAATPAEADKVLSRAKGRV